MLSSIIIVAILFSNHNLHEILTQECGKIRKEEDLVEDSSTSNLDPNIFHRLRKSCYRKHCGEEPIDYRAMLHETLVLGDFHLAEKHDTWKLSGNKPSQPKPRLLLMLLNPSNPRSTSDVSQTILALKSFPELTVVINVARDEISTNQISAFVSFIIQSGRAYIEQNRLFITTKSAFLEYSFGSSFGAYDLLVMMGGINFYFPKAELLLVYDQAYKHSVPFVSKAVAKASSVTRGIEASTGRLSNWCLVEIASHLGLLSVKLWRFVKFLPTFWKLPFDLRNNRSVTQNMMSLGVIHCKIPNDGYTPRYLMNPHG